MTHLLDFRSKGIETLLHFHHYRRKLAWASTPLFQLILSLVWWIVALLISHQQFCHQDCRGMSAHAGTLSWTPDGFRCTPDGQGLSPRRAAGKVAKGPEEGGLGGKKTSMGKGGICWFVRFSPLSLPPFKMVGSRFGSAGVFGLVSRDPFGPLVPVVPVLGIHGRPLYYPVLPRPWSLSFWALTSRERMWIDLGQVGFRIRHAWVFFSCLVGSFGPLAPVVPRWGTTGGRCFSMVCPCS
jgi:hypothetical protein